MPTSRAMLPPAAEMFLALTAQELRRARDAMVAAQDDDYRFAPLWPAVEARLAELEDDAPGSSART